MIRPIIFQEFWFLSILENQVLQTQYPIDFFIKKQIFDFYIIITPFVQWLISVDPFVDHGNLNHARYRFCKKKKNNAHIPWFQKTSTNKVLFKTRTKYAQVITNTYIHRSSIFQSDIGGYLYSVFSRPKKFVLYLIYEDS